MAKLSKYDVEVNGWPTTLLLSDEDAEARGLTKKVAPAAKAEKAPANKAAPAPANKASKPAAKKAPAKKSPAKKAAAKPAAESK